MQTYTAEQLLSPTHSSLLEEIILLISHSFTEDPSTKWIFNNHTRPQYTSVLPAYFRFITTAALLSGASVTVIHKGCPEEPQNTPSPPPTTSISTLTSHPNTQPPISTQESVVLPATSTIQALGMLIPPSGNTTFDSPLTYLKSGLVLLPFKCGFYPIYKVFTQIATPMSKMQDRIFTDPGQRRGFWQLLFLATHPDAQGRGLGRQILEEFQRVVRGAKGMGQQQQKGCIYLEASSAGSQRLYRRVGFVDRGDVSYGACIDEGGDTVVGEDGKVIGGRMFGMIWTP